MRIAIISGLFSILAAILAAVVPILWPKFESAEQHTLFANVLRTELSQSLVIEQFANLDLRAMTKKINFVQISNVSDEEIGQVSLELKLSTDWTNVTSGTRVSKRFFTGNLRLDPLGNSSYVAHISRFPPHSAVDLFLLSDDEFEVVSITSGTPEVDVLELWSLHETADRGYSWPLSSFLLAILAAIFAAVAYFRWTNRRITVRMERG